MVAVVDRHVITLSDLKREREIRSLVGEKPIEDDKALTKQMIENFLINRQIADYPNIDVADAEVAEELKKLNTNDTSDALREAVKQRIRVQKFFDLKFRQFIRPTESDVRKYYEEVFLPEARAKGLQVILPLSDPTMFSAIRDNVIQEGLDHEVEVWLEAIYRRSSIEILE